MRKLTLVILGVALLALRVLAAESGMEMFQRAVTLEKGGKLEEAIKLFEQVAAQFPKDKALAANALMRAAAGHRTRGNEKALKLYEQVVREYGDQSDAVKSARSMIALLRTPVTPTMTIDRRPLGDSVYWPVQSDGQHALWFDEPRVRLMFSDLDGKNARRVFDVDPRQIPEVTASHDLSTVLLHFVGGPGLRDHWAVLKSDGTGYKELRIPLAGANVLAAASFSWDNRYAVLGPALTKVNLLDGEVRTLLPDSAGVKFAAFSPDGRFIAYSPDNPWKIQIIAVDGGEPALVTNNRAVLDWTPEGDILAYTMSPAMEVRLFLIPMKNGTPATHLPIAEDQRAPLSNFSGQPMMAPDGSLIWRAGGVMEVKTAYADRKAEGGYGPWKNISGIKDEEYPTLSPSGKQLVYISRIGKVDQVRVRDLETSKERAVHEGVTPNVRACSFTPVETLLYCTERDPAAQTTVIVRVPLDGAGKVERLHTLDGMQVLSGVTPDGRGLVTTWQFARPAAGTYWEIGAATEKKLPGAGFASPNARWAMLEKLEPRRHRFDIRPIGELDDWTSLMLNARLDAPAQARFSRDGDWLVYRDSKTLYTNDQLGIYVRSLAGGEPERVGDYSGPLGAKLFFSASDGANRVLMQYTDQVRTREVTVLKNFVSKPTQ